MTPRHLSIGLLAVSCMQMPVSAADAFIEGMQAAYAPYRAALLRTHAKDVALRAATSSRDPAAVREALAKLKPPYSRMFLKYG